MHRSLRYSIILFVLTGLWSCSGKDHSAPPASPGVAETALENPDFSGRLYTSGLSAVEMEKLQLEPPVYQLSAAESYFFSGPDSLREYTGSCVGVRGVIKEGWEKWPGELNGQYTYGRVALDVSQIELLNLSACPEVEGEATALAPNGKAAVYSGRVKRMERPAPDIAYDYALVLEEPYQDMNHPVEPGKWVKELPLVTYKAEMMNQLEATLASNAVLKLKAFREQGYAEQNVLRLDTILTEK